MPSIDIVGSSSAASSGPIINAAKSIGVSILQGIIRADTRTTREGEKSHFETVL